MCPVYCYECSECGEQVEVLRSISDYDRPPDETEVGEDEQLTNGEIATDVRPCSHQFKRIIKDVAFMSTERHVGKMEFGKDRARQELIDANKIEKEMMNLPHDKRTEHKKKIKKLRSIQGDS